MSERIAKLEAITQKMWLKLLNSSLWIASISLSLFSAGIDGEWLSKLQAWPWMGYALNFSADLTGEVVMYQFCKLQKTSRKGSKKWRLSWVLLPCALLTLWYSWFFSWLQLRSIMNGYEPWVPVVVATFVPILLAIIGYTQAVVESKLEYVEAKEQHDFKKELKKALKEQESRLRKEFADEMAYNRRAPEWSSHQALERDGWKCFYCGVDMQRWSHDMIHVDHFYPLSKGGTDDPYNLVVSCSTCNLSKGARLPTADEVARFKMNLIAAERVNAKDKILLIDSLALAGQQKVIATKLDVSASYVSAVLNNPELELSETALNLRDTINQVGQPAVSIVEPPSEMSGDNGSKPERVEVREGG